jgi:hypothetical protein
MYHPEPTITMPNTYQKPKIVCFGTLRDLTQLGLNQDCDGGILGISASVSSATDGSWLGCRHS